MKHFNSRPFLTLATALFLVLFCLVPFGYMVLTSFARRPDYLGTHRGVTFTLEHYHDILSTPSLHFLDYLRNSLLISGASAASAVAIAALAGYALTRLRLPAKGAILLGVLAASLFPQVSLVSYLFRVMNALGWINTYPALILPYIAWVLPLSLWILVSYFAQIPLDLDRAARVDGCSRLQILLKVTLPVAAPGIFSTFLLAFIFAFNEFLFALILTTDYRARTVPVGIALFQGLHGQIPWGLIMAASVFTTLPVVALTLIFQRRIVQGLTRGAVKG
ncbi:MAG: carbohydrate ABC transporter permease [Desulfuromonadales bacterium]|jgi:multiple sugar transport system permease protein